MLKTFNSASTEVLPDFKKEGMKGAIKDFNQALRRQLMPLILQGKRTVFMKSLLGKDTDEKIG